tara:strand:- start:156 stop:455 length:300 start_codon:yes stop_codon:yes gene_type:complete
MPIHKRDRNFQSIVRELEIKNIPAEFIDKLTLVCENDDRITFDGETMNDSGEDDLVANLIKLVEENQDLESQVVDVEIIIDYKKLEAEVNKRTEKLLKK